MRTVAQRAVAALLVMFALAACGNDPTAPTETDGPAFDVVCYWVNGQYYCVSS